MSSLVPERRSTRTADGTRIGHVRRSSDLLFPTTARLNPEDARLSIVFVPCPGVKTDDGERGLRSRSPCNATYRYEPLVRDSLCILYIYDVSGISDCLYAAQANWM